MIHEPLNCSQQPCRHREPQPDQQTLLRVYFLFFYSILVCSILALPQLSSTHPQLTTLGGMQTQSHKAEERVESQKGQENRSNLGKTEVGTWKQGPLPVVILANVRMEPTVE